MTASEVESWLHSKRRVVIDSVELRPKSHPLLAGTPLSIAAGQAVVLLASASDQSSWIIKKFHPGMAPDRVYLTTIRTLLPPSPAFACGTERRLVSPADVQGSYRPAPLVNWLDGTILMPCLKGVDWAYVADQLREGDLTLPIEPRARMCRGLAEAVATLEADHCSHRDLSSGNVFVDEQTWAISLIDWDSVYHPDLIMPPNTTGGTKGYIAPFVVWVDGKVTPQSTWQPMADRFALALLCTEFLAVDEDSRSTEDGGIFDQEELRRRQGTTIDAARRALATAVPDAIPLFDRALQANGYQDCPEPEEWIQLADSRLGVVTVPTVPVASDWFDEDRFWVGQIERVVAPPVVVLPEDWGTSTLTSPATRLDPAIVPFEAWGSNAQGSADSPAAGIVLPEAWGNGSPGPPGQPAPDPAIVPFEAWGSDTPLVSPVDAGSRKDGGT